MGYGSWDDNKFKTYTVKTKMGTFDRSGYFKSSMSNQEMFKSRSLDPKLDPHGVIRECKDSDEHPNTIPVILALDVTGSMGDAAVECAKSLNVIMTELYNSIKDVEFLIMGIGDFYCDRFPVQASQFESDIRIAEQLDLLYFEFGGGGNDFESYSAAWWFGLHHTSLDCIKRGKKGIIITIGDETLNPYIPITGSKTNFMEVLGDSMQENIDTVTLYKEASKMFNIHHIDVNHSQTVRDSIWTQQISDSFKLLGEHFHRGSISEIKDIIIGIISSENSSFVQPLSPVLSTPESSFNSNGEITW